MSQTEVPPPFSPDGDDLPRRRLPGSVRSAAVLAALVAIGEGITSYFALALMCMDSTPPSWSVALLLTKLAGDLGMVLMAPALWVGRPTAWRVARVWLAALMVLLLFPWGLLAVSAPPAGMLGLVPLLLYALCLRYLTSRSVRDYFGN